MRFLALFCWLRPTEGAVASKAGAGAALLGRARLGQAPASLNQDGKGVLAWVPFYSPTASEEGARGIFRLFTLPESALPIFFKRMSSPAAASYAAIFAAE